MRGPLGTSEGNEVPPDLILRRSRKLAPLDHRRDLLREDPLDWMGTQRYARGTQDLRIADLLDRVEHLQRLCVTAGMLAGEVLQLAIDPVSVDAAQLITASAHWPTVAVLPARER